MSLTWHAISVKDSENPAEELFSGYFSVDAEHRVTGFYETVDGQTNFLQNILGPAQLPPEGVSPQLDPATNMFVEGAFVGSTNIVSERVKDKLVRSGMVGARSGFSFRTSTTLATTADLQQVVVDVSDKADLSGADFTGTVSVPSLSFTNNTVVRVGESAGMTGQAGDTVAVGKEAGMTNQGGSAVAVGSLAGRTGQSDNAVAVGLGAGYEYQSIGAVAVGYVAGRNTQGIGAVAVGDQAGSDLQGVSAVAVGKNAGVSEQGAYCVAIGRDAGQEGQGGNAVAIGNRAGVSNQHANSIILNATGANLNSDGTGRFYVNPVRNASAPNVVEYNPQTYELTQTYFNNGPYAPLLNPLSEGLNSANTTTWTLRNQAAETSGWECVVWCPQLRLFISSRGTGALGGRFQTSPDGVNWTLQSNPSDVEFDGAGGCWSEQLGLAVFVSSAPGSITDRAMTTSDGVSYTLRTMASTMPMRDVEWSPALGLFVAVGDRVIQTSPDGISWTVRYDSFNAAFREVVWSPQLGRFVAVGSGVSASTRTMWSADGINWVIQGSSSSLSCVEWSPQLGMFVALSSVSTTGFLTSTNGISWVPRTFGTSYITWNNIKWSPQLGRFVAIGASQSLTSADGVNWTPYSITSRNWLGLAWSPELSLFVACGTDPSANSMATSSFSARVPTQTNVFDSDSNRLDNNGDWSFRANNVTTPNTCTLGSTGGNTVVRTNTTGAGGTIELLGGSGMVSDTAGASTGQYLVLTVNGIQYKIALLAMA